MPYRRKDSPYWWISYSDGRGGTVRQSSGLTDKRAAAKDEAEHRLRASQRRVAPRSFNEAILHYLSEKPSPRAAQAAKRLLEHFSGRVVDTIRAADVTDYIARRRERGIGDGTIGKELGVASAAVRHCQRRHDWECRNPFEGMSPPAPPGRLRWLTRQEVDAIKAAVDHQAADYLPDFIEFAVHTGMRSGEILDLTWDRVDLDNRLVYLYPEQAKSRRQQAVPLNRDAAAILERRKGGRWVFERKGEPIGSVKKAFRSAATRAGLRDVSPHTLRHTCAAWLVQRGVPIRTVAEVLRHTDIRTTLRYAHLAPDDAAAAVALLERTELREEIEKNVQSEADFSVPDGGKSDPSY